MISTPEPLRPHLQNSLLAAPLEAPLLTPDEALADFGNTLIVAPHPDDETLGCGGIIALLCATLGVPGTRVLVLTDGVGSHPNSRQFPASARRNLREGETLQAMQRLGCEEAAGAVTFLGWPDGTLPDAPETVGFAQAQAAVAHCLKEFAIRTVLVPWRRDTHPDHRAAYQLVTAAVASAETTEEPGAEPCRLIEYPLWIWERGAAEDAPQAAEARAWRLDVSTVLQAKRNAIQEHRSQLGQVIADDPAGFCLEPPMLAHFARPWELFLESPDSASAPFNRKVA